MLGQPDLISDENESTLKPFKIDEFSVNDYCVDCKVEKDCAILANTNKLYKIRLLKAGKPVEKINSEFGCVMFEEK